MRCYLNEIIDKLLIDLSLIINNLFLKKKLFPVKLRQSFSFTFFNILLLLEIVERASSKSPNTMNFYSEERERLKYDLAKRFLYLFFPPSPLSS